MDLYTSLVRAKQKLNGRVLPAMTPIPEKLHAILDPAFTIGLGALMEDREKGLRCPVRGCGEWRHKIKHHWDTAHAGIGGSDGLRRALSLPVAARLVSQKMSGRLREQAARMGLASIASLHRARGKIDHAKRVRNSGRTQASVGYRNLRNTCEAQLVQRLLSVRDRVGRSPSLVEAMSIDPQMARNARHLFGSWNGFKAAAGLKTERWNRSVSKEHVVHMLAAWVEVHGTLPTHAEASRPTRLPLIPSCPATCRAFETTSWPEAMRRAAVHLGIRGGRYGLPPQDADAG